MKTLHWILLACCAADAARALTLDECLQTARRDNPELRAARAQIESAAGRAGQTRLWPNPELEVVAEEVPIHSGGLSQSKNLVGLSQTVPFPGKKSLDARIGGKEVSAAEWEFAQREADLVRTVTTTFYRALAAEKKLAVSGELVELSRSTATAARKRVESGAASDQEQLRAEIELDRAQVESAAGRAELTEARKNLARLMGRASGDFEQLEGELRESIELPELAMEELLKRHPRSRVASANRDRAELELRRAKLEPWPDVTLGVAGGRAEGENETLMEFRVSLPLPIFDRAQGRKRETRALAEIARYDLTATEQELAEELSVLQARLQAASEQVAAYRERILPKAEESLRLVRGGFDAGKFGFLDLVDTQRTVAEARLAYLEKLLELNIAIADWEALAATPSKE